MGKKVWSLGSKSAVRFYPYDSVGMAPPNCDSSNQKTLQLVYNALLLAHRE